VVGWWQTGLKRENVAKHWESNTTVTASGGREASGHYRGQEARESFISAEATKLDFDFGWQKCFVYGLGGENTFYLKKVFLVPKIHWAHYLYRIWSENCFFLVIGQYGKQKFKRSVFLRWFQKYELTLITKCTLKKIMQETVSEKTTSS
jgi:hypothetical protein